MSHQDTYRWTACADYQMHRVRPLPHGHFHETACGLTTIKGWWLTDRDLSERRRCPACQPWWWKLAFAAHKLLTRTK